MGFDKLLALVLLLVFAPFLAIILFLLAMVLLLSLPVELILRALKTHSRRSQSTSTPSPPDALN